MIHVAFRFIVKGGGGEESSESVRRSCRARCDVCDHFHRLHRKFVIEGMRLDRVPLEVLLCFWSSYSL